MKSRRCEVGPAVAVLIIVLLAAGAGLMLLPMLRGGASTTTSSTGSSSTAYTTTSSRTQSQTTTTTTTAPIPPAGLRDEQQYTGYIDCEQGVPWLEVRADSQGMIQSITLYYATDRFSANMSTSPMVVKVYDEAGSLVGQAGMEYDHDTGLWIGSAMLDSSVCGAYHELDVQVWSTGGEG